MQSVTTETASLSEAQEGLWFAQSLDSDNPIFNTAKYTQIEGDLDVAAFKYAVDTAMGEATALSVSVVDTDQGPVQVFGDQPVELQVIASDLQGALHDIQTDSNTAVDLSDQQATVQRLYVVAQNRYIWYQRIHHVVIDGYGTSLLTARIADLYLSKVSGSSPKTRPFGDFSDVLEEDRQYKHSDKRNKDRQYWIDTFSNSVEVGQIGRGIPQSAHTFHRSSAILASDFLSDIELLATRLDYSWPDVLTALCAIYIKRLSLGEQTVVGVPAMNRLGSRSANVPAMVMNVLPVIVSEDYDAEQTTEEFISKFCAQLKKSRRHARYRSEQLRRDLGLIGDSKRLYGSLINVLPFEDEPHIGLKVETTVLSTGPVDDLTFTFRQRNASSNDNRIVLEIDGNANIYSATDIEDHVARVQSFISRAIRSASFKNVAPDDDILKDAMPRNIAHSDVILNDAVLNSVIRNDAILNDITLLTTEEEQRWLIDFNATQHYVPKTTLVNLISEASNSHSENIAVRDQHRSITYKQLNEESDRVAIALSRFGVTKGDIVGVGIPRSVDLMITLLAILKTGAAYLPIDTTHPEDRIRQVLDSAKPKLVLYQASDIFGDVVSDNVALDTDGNGIESPESENAVGYKVESPESVDTAEYRTEPPKPEDAAYIIYTSGSTGTPKGVVIEHLAIVNRLLWMKEHYNITNRDRILQKTPTTFDVSVWELFLPLISGATLIMAPPESHKDPSWLAQIIRESSITTLHFVPSMLAVFLSEPGISDLKITRVFCSGEALPASLRDRFHSILTETELHNLYGPTEAAVDVTYWNACKEDTTSPLPIGMPVWNTQMYVLDDHYRPLPPGIVGHLYIGGIQLAREYFGQKKLTAQRFVKTSILSDSPDRRTIEQRIYITGDLAYLDRNGAIVYVGRSDHQVKIRGFRIELGDIEVAINKIEAVDQAHVIVRDDYGSPELVAYITLKSLIASERNGNGVNAGLEGVNTGLEGANSNIERVNTSIEMIRNFISRSLPEYMIPGSFIILPEMPITSNGKLDRAKLPAPQRLSSSQSTGPQSPTEHRVAELFAETLGIETNSNGKGDGNGNSIQREDDFFALGGHSLLAAKLMAKVREEWDCDLRLGAVFANPTVARLASAIERSSTGQSTSVGLEPVIKLSNGSLGRIFCIHPAGGISWCYGALSRELSGYSVYALQSTALNPSAKLQTSLTELSTEYVERVISLSADGEKIHLLGWSVGGIIAHEMASQLEIRGKNVGIIAMLDSYPSDMWRDEPEPDEASALKALMLIAGFDPDSTTEIKLTRESVIEFLRTSNHPLADLTDNDLNGVMRSVELNARLVRKHRHNHFNGRVLHFRAELDHQGKNLHASMWNPYVAEVVELGIPSVHAYMTSPKSSALVANELLHEFKTLEASSANSNPI